MNVRAFGRTLEADLVDKLRNNRICLLSLVAVKQNEIVGHILFSPVAIENGDRNVQGMGLAPMSVLPEHQRQGIGSKLIRTGITMLKDQQCPFVIVLGHVELSSVRRLGLGSRQLPSSGGESIIALRPS